MKAILILSGHDSSCSATKNIWQDICLKNNIKFKLFDLSSHEGEEIAKELNIKSFPALIINDNVVAVGHPDVQMAEKVVQKLVK